MPTVEERSRYESDFGVSWLRLPVLVAGALLAAVAVAWGLKLAFVHGWYLIILLPVAGGAALAGVLYVLVGWTHCRNYWLAGSIGVLVGLIAYLGYYHLCLMDLLPPGNAWRVDVLPKYIQLRMQTDVAEEVGKPRLNPQGKKPFAPLNYFGFACELLMVVGLAASFSWNRARRAYCMELGQWMQQDKALLAPHSSTKFHTALDTDTLSQFVAQTAAGSDQQTASRLILEYAVPETGSAFEFPIYASFEDLPVPRPWYRPRQLRRTFVRQVELELAEILALRPLFPKLARLLESQHSELRDLPAEVLSTPSPPLETSDRAEITPIPESYRRRVRGKGYALRVNLLGLTPLIYLFGGMGLIVGSIVLFRDVSIPLGCIAEVAGGAGIFWGIYVSQFCSSVPENRWIERRLRQEIAGRPESIVDPQDPESSFVSLIPRESFSKIQWTMASDVVLYKLDKNRRQLLMEGDADRYRIPSGAISVCEPQCFFHPIDAGHKKQIWMVRLMIVVEQGARELLLSINQTRWNPMTNERRRRLAEDTCRRIAELCGQDKA
ncbi:MAG TPA: hypothetical protein VH592_04365 [Gemmataceae bacterium]|jgi:hypothetical protein